MHPISSNTERLEQAKKRLTHFYHDTFLNQKMGTIGRLEKWDQAKSTLNICYYEPSTFQIVFFCLSAMASKCILSKLICMLMDFSLAVFCNTFVVIHNFGEEKIICFCFYCLFFLFFFGRKSF